MIQGREDIGEKVKMEGEEKTRKGSVMEPVKQRQNEKETVRE